MLRGRSLTPLLPLRLLASVIVSGSWCCCVPGIFRVLVDTAVVSSNGRVTISSRWFVLGLLMTDGCCLLTFTCWLVLVPAELDEAVPAPPLCLGIAPVFLLHRPAGCGCCPCSTVAFAVITPDVRLGFPCWCCGRGWWPDWWPPFFVFDCPARSENHRCYHNIFVSMSNATRLKKIFWILNKGWKCDEIRYDIPVQW